MNATVNAMEQGSRGTRSFVVNLCAASTPAALSMPEGPGFDGHAFVVTRSLEEGRERFRLQMGYFASLAEARDKTLDVRTRFPAAWAGPAPQAAPAATRAENPVLESAQMLSLLETGQLTAPGFAVHLLWSPQPLDHSVLPQPALFDVYTLYQVEGLRDGQRWYGIRLGFFADVDAAKRVAAYLKPHYAKVAVVPVTASERERASDEAVEMRQHAPAATPADPFAPEHALLPAAPSPRLELAPSRHEPFELLPMAPAAPPTQSTLTPTGDAAPASRGVESIASRRASQPTARKADPGRAHADTWTLECLGASNLGIVEEKRGLPLPVSRAAAAPAPAMPKREGLGLAKLFGRRRA
jgi:hypothetical protein